MSNFETLLVLAPTSGARLRVTNAGVNDAGVVYTYKQELKPITIGDDPGIRAYWQKFGLEIRHAGAVDLLVTPIVDSVVLAAQQFALAASAPASEQRIVLSGWFAAWGTKCGALIETNTLPAVFSIDGAWFEGTAQPQYRT